MKTGVQSVRKALKTLDSGFRRNDVKKNQIDFFTPSLRLREYSETEKDIDKLAKKNKDRIILTAWVRD